MYRELARAREISHVTHSGALTLNQTGRNIKQAYQIHSNNTHFQQHTYINPVSLFLRQHFEIIRLSSPYQLAWNLVVFWVIFYSFLANLFSIFITSAETGPQATHQPFHQVSKYLTAAILLIDFLWVRWRVEELDQLQKHRSHDLISTHYLKRYFVMDLIVLVVVLLDVSTVPFSYWNLLIYLKTFMLQQIKMQITTSLIGHPHLQLLFKTVRLLCFIIFWSFLFACIFVNIELSQLDQRGFQYQNGFLWLTASPALGYLNLYENFPWIVWFEYALFFIMQMVRGAGMGVPSPRSPLAMLWYNIANCTMTVVFCYFTDRVLWMVHKYSNQDSFLHHLITLKHIPQLSEAALTKYTDFLTANKSPQIKSAELQDQLSQMFPQTLRCQFNFALKQHFLLRFVLLRNLIGHSFTEELFKRQLAQIIQTKITYQGEVLFRQNEVAPQRLYLSEGTNFTVENPLIDYAQKLPEWSFVGTRQFFIEQKSLFTVSSNQISTLEYLEKDKFIQVVKFCPMMYESYCENIDSIRIERENTQSLELICWHCGEYHLHQDCKKVTLDKAGLMARLVLRRLNLSIDQDFTTDHFKEQLPFFRNMRRSSKVRELRKARLEIDQYKRRGFSYMRFNLQKVEFRKKQTLKKAAVIQSEMFKLSLIRQSSSFIKSAETLSIIGLDS